MRLRSVGARLSLALALVVAVALGVGYAVVVPALERNLTQAKLDQLTRTAEAEARRFPTTSAFGLTNPFFLEDLEGFMPEAAASTNARVVLLTPLANKALSVQADSRETSKAPDVTDDQVALRATLTGASARDIVVGDGRKFAEVAFPILTGSLEPTVLLFVAPLDDTLATVELVQRRLLTAAAVALLVALLLGYGGASVFARRLRRLERAADRIAQGSLDEPVIDHGSDEVAQLAHAFERMRQRLAQLEHARREFIANASHELRTPIFSLGGFLELLDDEELDDETRREFVGTMQGQIERLTKLAADLLDLSRLDAGRLRIELEPVDLRRLARALADEFAALARASEHNLGVVVAEHVPAALADEARLLQIGRILVENALKHTSPGTAIAIRIGGDGDRALLAVEDAGGGIAPEHADQVFERFYRVDGAHASGSGLGLAIARELAEAMHGTLELESRPRRTVFALRLPVAAAVPEAAPAGSGVP
jgi:two-component system OmpR family sensor kinase